MMYLFPYQCYINMAEKDKERYVREYMAYQETDSYKEFMRKKYPGLAKKRKVEHKAEAPSQQTTKEKVSYHSIPGKHPLLGKRPCTEYQRVSFHIMYGIISRVSAHVD